MPPISATIIAQDEEKNIARAIRSLACADEVIVVDSGSTDQTPAIAKSLGATVIAHPWPGYAAQKNFATELARHDWILSLDADEELNAEAIAGIQRWKQTAAHLAGDAGVARASGTLESAVAGYRFARCAFYLGRWIRHSGWYPDYKLRLFHRAQGQWRGSYVHESAVVDGAVETLPGEILHYSFDSLEDHYRRIELYTGLAARDLAAGGRSASALQRVFAPPWTFAQTYFLKLGFLDGPQGFLIARAAAHYVRRKYEKLRQIQNGRP
jgi:glycosyltransferase involved in cell wall biosynthesis